MNRYTSALYDEAYRKDAKAQMDKKPTPMEQPFNAASARNLTKSAIDRQNTALNGKLKKILSEIEAEAGTGGDRIRRHLP